MLDVGVGKHLHLLVLTQVPDGVALFCIDRLQWQTCVKFHDMEKMVRVHAKGVVLCEKACFCLLGAF